MKGILAKLCRALAALVLALGACATANAGIPQTEYAVQTCIAPLAKVAGKGQAQSADQFVCEGRQSALGSGDFAVELRFDPIELNLHDPLELHVAAIWQQQAEFEFRYADGTNRRVSFHGDEASKFAVVGSDYQIPVPHNVARLTSVTGQVQGSANWRGVMLGAELKPHSVGMHEQMIKTGLYAGFFGLVLGLLIYNLAVWWAQRNRFQIYYCGMVASLIGYAVTSSGAIYLIWPDLHNNDRLRIDYLVLALAASCALQFTRHFFGPSVIGPKLNLVSKVVQTAIILSTAALVLMAPWNGLMLFRSYILSLVGMMLFMPVVCGFALRARNPYAGLFMLAWAAPIGVSFARALSSVGLLPYSFWLENGNLIALSLEAIISTLLIVKRLGELGEERDTALAGEKSAIRLANSDSLTGLLNRRAFIEAVVGRTERHRLLLIDIDHFKSINDRLGHDFGDQVLRELAQVLQRCRPNQSLPVRLGGEEFGLLVPMQTPNDPGFSADVVLAAVRKMKLPLDMRITVSIGVAEGTVKTDTDWRRLYRLADSALYRAKADGRDRSCRATDFGFANVA